MKIAFIILFLSLPAMADRIECTIDQEHAKKKEAIPIKDGIVSIGLRTSNKNIHRPLSMDNADSYAIFLDRLNPGSSNINQTTPVQFETNWNRDGDRAPGHKKSSFSGKFAPADFKDNELRLPDLHIDGSDFKLVFAKDKKTGQIDHSKMQIVMEKRSCQEFRTWLGKKCIYPRSIFNCVRKNIPTGTAQAYDPDHGGGAR